VATEATVYGYSRERILAHRAERIEKIVLDNNYGNPIIREVASNSNEKQLSALQFRITELEMENTRLTEENRILWEQIRMDKR
jgi:hypothetical protein